MKQIKITVIASAKIIALGLLRKLKSVKSDF